MKSPLNIITTFNRIKDENGADHFTGTIDLATLKKTKLSEIEIVLIPIESIPKTLTKLLNKSVNNKDGLIMFAGTTAPEATNNKGGQEK